MFVILERGQPFELLVNFKQHAKLMCSVKKSCIIDVIKAIINEVPVTSKTVVDIALQGPHISKYKCFQRFGKQLKSSFSERLSKRKLVVQISFSFKFRFICKTQFFTVLLTKSIRIGFSYFCGG